MYPVSNFSPFSNDIRIKSQMSSGEKPDTVMCWYRQMKDENIAPDLKLAYSVLTFYTRNSFVEGICLVLNDIRSMRSPLDSAIIQYFMDNLKNIPEGRQIRDMLSRYPDLMDENAHKRFQEWRD